jgi:hypothetical protein
MKRPALALSLVALYTFLLAPLAPAWAQTLTLPEGADVLAPSIKHDPPSQSALTTAPLTIEAAVTDNVGVQDVTLYYRQIGSSDFTTVTMALRGGDTYAVTIPPDRVAEPGVEYYIQAADVAGNMALRGFAFDPLVVTVALTVPPPVVTVTPEPLPALDEPPPSPADALAMRTEPDTGRAWYKKWWVWTLVGSAVLIGAAASGGDGGGDSAGNTSTGSNPPPSGTGSITITGPIPE